MKGKKARSGRFHPRYEGGQTPLQRRVPKSGRSKRSFSFEPTSYVNLSKILYCINKGRLDPFNKIDIKDMVKAGAVSSPKHGLRLLGRGGSSLKKTMMPNGVDPIPPLKLEVSSATKPAIDFVKASGGSVTCVYRTPLTMRYHLRPDKWDIPPRDPQTPPKKAYSMEKLRQKGAEVVYVPTEWFKDPKHIESLHKMEKSRSNRAEKLRALGKGIRIKPMFTRKIDFFFSKDKKRKKKGDKSVVEENEETKEGKTDKKEAKESKNKDSKDNVKGKEEKEDDETKAKKPKKEKKKKKDKSAKQESEAKGETNNEENEQEKDTKSAKRSKSENPTNKENDINEKENTERSKSVEVKGEEVKENKTSKKKKKKQKAAEEAKANEEKNKESNKSEVKQNNDEKSKAKTDKSKEANKGDKS